MLFGLVNGRGQESAGVPTRPMVSRAIVGDTLFGHCCSRSAAGPSLAVRGPWTGAADGRSSSLRPMRTVILCGGRGTRAYPHTEDLPKPLLEVGGEPVLLHLLRIYAHQGFRDFVLAAGYLAEHIEAFAATLPEDWDVEVVDTGEGTGTAGRILKVRDRVDGTFMANYADGLADIDLAALLAHHRSAPGCATLATVPLPSPYGTVATDPDGTVTGFREKPRLSEHRINGGFFVFDERVFDLWAGDDLERDVLPALAAAGELAAYEHQGFWRSLDTYKDAVALTELAAGADPPPWQPPARRRGRGRHGS